MAKKKTTRRRKKPGTIKAKPTKYRGVVHRSRLEAKWAVFFDFHFMAETCVYEPRKFTDPETGWDYLPDFYLNFGSVFHYYLEVKPVMPDASYLEDLTAFIPVLPAPLLLCVGDFYKSAPVVHRFNNDGVGVAEEVIDVFMEGKEALEAAQGFRFDLPENKRPRPSFRQSSGLTPIERHQAYATQKKTEALAAAEKKRGEYYATKKPRRRPKRNG